MTHGILISRYSPPDVFVKLCDGSSGVWCHPAVDLLEYVKSLVLRLTRQVHYVLWGLMGD